MKFALVFFCLRIAESSASLRDLELLINSLNKGLGTRTNVYFGDSKGEFHLEASRVLRTSIPQILSDERSEMILKKNFNANALLIVFLEKYPTPAIFANLLVALKNRRRTHVLVTVDECEDGRHLRILQWFWRYGFYNVLFYDVASSAGGQLLTFLPFPEVHLHNTSVEAYLGPEHQQACWSDFKGYSIRVISGNTPPMAFMYHNKYGKTMHSGVMPTIFKMFMKHHNASFLREPLPNYYSKYYWFDCVSFLRQGRADVCDYSAPMTSPPNDFAVSYPLVPTHTYLMVPHAKPLPKYVYFRVPFQSSIWLAIVLLLLYSAFVVALIHWRRSGRWELGVCMLEALKSLIYVAFHLPLRQGALSRYLQVILFISGFIFSILYLSLLSSILSTSIYGPQVNSFKDLRVFNISILYDTNYTAIYETRSIPHIVWQRMLRAPLHDVKRWRNNLNGFYAYICQVEVCKFYLYQQKFLQQPRMKLLDQVLFSEYNGFPVAENWPLKDLLDQHLRKMFEGGLHQRIQMQTLQEGISAGYIRFFPTQYYHVHPLPLTYFALPLFILSVGLAAGGVCFALEHYLYRRRR